jgi:flagellar assembly protein FliH
MGKVIKGSADSGERYTVALPPLFVAGQPRAVESTRVDDLETPLVMPEIAAAPAEPQIDLEAIAAQAQELLDDAARRAQQLIDAAQQRASEMIEDATSRAQALAADARREGHVEGHAAGVSDAAGAMSEMLATMRGLIEAVRTERHALLTSAEPELVRLAVGIAERVLHQQIALDPGVVVEMARAAISRIVDRETITVRVNPADIEQMRVHRDELLALGDVKTMRVIEDQRVDRGGIVLETDAGTIDAKISTQLTEVRKILNIDNDLVVQTAPAQAAADDGTALTSGRAS